jgi:hypothetical protein
MAMIYTHIKQNPNGKVKLFKELQPRICDEEDVGPDLFAMGTLLICPPKEGIELKG